MNLAEKKIVSPFEYQSTNDHRFQLYREQSDVVQNTFAEDVHEGLTSTPKRISPKYFYDDAGSELFDKITSTREYYPTRTERKILMDNIDQLRELCPNVELIAELGSGTSDKTKILLDSFLSTRQKLIYMPIDVSDILIPSSESLLNRHDNLNITGIIAGYEPGLSLLAEFDEVAKLIIFLGSSIGNFENNDAKELMQNIADSMTRNDYVLVGFDRVKDVNVLNEAYNDSDGYTEAFNLNMLHRINTELDANFDLNQFRHKAFYNSLASRIEMHLVSETDQNIVVNSLDEVYQFRKGESIHTENSHKFDDTTIDELASAAGLKVVKNWTDENNYFSLIMFSLA